MKKILLILLAIVVIIVVAGVLFVMSILPQDQVTLQYDEEVISSHKRVLDYSSYDLESYNNYDVVDEYSDKTIVEIQKAILESQFSVEDLCLYYLTRIQKYESYNAVLQLNQDILKQARVIDEKIKNSEELGDLFGVVVMAKDNIAVEGMNTAAGAYALKDLTTTRDATIIAELKSNDALIIGKANLSEWSNFMSMPSSSGFSVLGGQTKNAYGKYDVGGSSSGSSVAAALNLATVTIGTETAGSLIFPAGQNSVVALKPTMGLLSRDLIVPISEAQDTAGIISRNISDLNTVFHKILLNDEHDTASEIVDDYDSTVVLDEQRLTGKKLAVVHNGTDEMNGIISDFEALGATVEVIELSEEAYQADMMSVLNYGIINDVNAFLNNEAVISEFNSIDAILEFNKTDDSYMPYGQSLIETAKSQENSVEAIIISNRKLTQSALDTVFDQGYDAIISMSNELSGVYAAAGYPALTIPSGYRVSGEPFGVTLVGGYLKDQSLIEMGYAYEANTHKRKSIK